jgi:hypothetical protein
VNGKLERASQCGNGWSGPSEFCKKGDVPFGSLADIAAALPMSALPSKADISENRRHVG